MIFIYYKRREMENNKWHELGVKDKIQYSMAIMLIVSGIAAAFVCIIFNSFDISTGVLIYIAQAFVTSGGLLSVSIYFRTKLGEFDTRQKQELGQMLDALTNTIIDKLSKKNDEHID